MRVMLRLSLNWIGLKVLGATHGSKWKANRLHNLLNLHFISQYWQFGSVVRGKYTSLSTLAFIFGTLFLDVRKHSIDIVILQPSHLRSTLLHFVFFLDAVHMVLYQVWAIEYSLFTLYIWQVVLDVVWLVERIIIVLIVRKVSWIVLSPVVDHIIFVHIAQWWHWIVEALLEVDWPFTYDAFSLLLKCLVLIDLFRCTNCFEELVLVVDEVESVFLDAPIR